MCIRDSDKAPLRDSLLQSFTSGNAPDILSLDGRDVPYRAYMHSQLPFDGYMDSSYLYSFLSVSYTHLDVYKRQLQSFVQTLRSMIIRKK